ncbi:MAG: group 1 glycosyl transferase [Bacteroidota bacterium]|nr:group 1 glycosyl transferase [Bacteroidota bacterium]
MTLPRVLIFGQPFNRNSGGGITLSNLFNGWEKDKIAVACTGHMTNNLTTDICNHYYQLGNKEQKWVFPFNKFQKKFESGVLKITNNAQEFNQIPSKPGIRKRFVDQIFYPSLRYFGLFYNISSIKLSNEFCRWLNEFKPDILYVQVSERDAILFAQALQSFLKIPMIIHIMDDWPTTISSKGIFKNYWRKKIDKEFRELLNRASLLMSISDAMASEYKDRYGKKFITFHNPINIEFWKQQQRNHYDLNNPPSILYAGRIGIGIETSLELIARSIHNVNKELRISIKFILQTQDKLTWFNQYNFVEHRPFVSYIELPKKFSEADLLILPYDFSKKSIDFIRYSMPTKAPEYMISGTPILIFAPEMTAIVKYAQKLKWAKVVTQKNTKELEEAIKFLLQNKIERTTLANNAKQIAEKNHDSIIITNNFRKVICDLTNGEFAN